MSIIQVPNISFESTANNKIAYDPSTKNISVQVGGVNTVISNSSGLTLNTSSINSGANVIANATGIYVGNSTVNVAITAGAVTVNALSVKEYAVNTQQFCSTLTWNKPTLGNYALVQVWGAGGGGELGSRCCGSCYGGGGGGGGAYNEKIYHLACLANTETATVGLGGSGGLGGGFSSFTVGGVAKVYAYGGAGGTADVPGPGGGGGGIWSSGCSITPGAPLINVYGGGNGGNSTVAANSSVYGGGGGGVGDGSNPGGNSIYGGGGGGGGPCTTSTVSGGTSIYGGAGGAGNKAAIGGNGSVPGGGGGGTRDRTKAGGAGANGRIIVYVF